jgi:hypothetical protein
MNLRTFIKQVLNETYGSAVMYSAVVIEDPAEIQKIENLAKEYVPAGWAIPYHYHMTIGQGSIPESLRLKGDLNKEVEITINSIGISDRAVAFGTFGYYSRNEMPHITLAFNRKRGGQPADSKSIENWTDIDKIIVKGIVREIDFNNKVLK